MSHQVTTRSKAKKQLQGSKQIVYEDFHPSTIEWSQEPGNHVLRVDIPGFKKEDLKVQVDSSGKLTITGQRQVEESRYSCLELVFDVPKDATVDKISGKLDDGRLVLTIPKREAPRENMRPAAVPPASGSVAPGGAAAKEEASGGEDGEKKEKSDGEESEEGLWRWGYGRELVDRLKEKISEKGLVEKINENKKVIVVAVVAFSVGFYVSRKMRSS